MDSAAYDQRLGKRRQLETALTASWTVPRKRLVRTRIVDEPVRIIDVSPTGAGLIAQSVLAFVSGVRTTLILDDQHAEITI